MLKPYYRVVFPNKLHILFCPTLRCNYHCSYCMQVKEGIPKDYKKSRELSVDQWEEAFSRLPPSRLLIAGGEPLLYEGLPDLLNRIAARHSLLGMVSNGSTNVHLLRQIRQPVTLNVSFHREHTDEATFVQRIEELRQFAKVSVYIVATGENLPLVRELRQRFEARGVPLHVDPCTDMPVDYSAEQVQELRTVVTPDREMEWRGKVRSSYRKRCSAGRNYIWLNPDGEALSCGSGFGYTRFHSRAPLLADRSVAQFKIGNVLDKQFRLRAKDVTCDLPCIDACDVDHAIINILHPLP